MIPTIYKFLLLIWCVCLIIPSSIGDDTCSIDGVCTEPRTADDLRCDMPEAVCSSTGSTTSIYDAGGTAQAYKPGAPIETTVCDSESSSSLRYRLASWPYSRSSKKSPPQLFVKVNLLSCSQQSHDKNPVCCCEGLPSSLTQNLTLDVWQTRPDGTYSSIRKSHEDGECRARVPFSDDNTMAVAEFTTFAPGSTGSLGGLGPSKWEFMPYGPPVIHMYVAAPGYDPLLVDVPILLHQKTLEQRSFKWSDWRGSAWMKSQTRKQPFQIVSWKEDETINALTIVVDLYLLESTTTSTIGTVSSPFCSSSLYGLPQSFFVEPISVCAPSLLDYFAL